MNKSDTVVAVFADHQAAETAIKQLTDADFDMKHLTLVGKGYHSEEKVMGFYSTGDRVKFWVLAAHSGAGFGACFLAACS